MFVVGVGDILLLCIVKERIKGRRKKMLYSREILNFLVKKDARKILKRKDSDAGERVASGFLCKPWRLVRLLVFFDVADRPAFLFLYLSLQEELWKNCGLLYSADSARLKAQSDMNNDHVALSLLLRSIFWLLLVLQGVGFSFPVCLSFIHYTLSWALMAILKAFSVLPASPSSKSSHLSLFTLGCVMSLSTGLANVSLKYNSVRFYQMAKIAVTPSIVLAEFIWFKKRASFSKVVALSVVSIGVVVATVTDLQFSLIGACVALAWIIPSAVNKILWSTLQQQDNWTALAFMWKTAPITLLFLATLIPFFDPSGVFSYDWNFRNTALILTSALLGFLLQWSGALALG
ncbi:hypothetical protein DKX38_028623 [Salix brachista]|uniref:Sugar phosphate transporter domain-containing protein n=1 Tax=Salix brachista TaxID=2182728 RepID=A0A5N5JHQ5_9ROSI|nr:hypothetical protein DKX38_028623 [Salix brachista]